jgi:hypothetical protein
MGYLVILSVPISIQLKNSMNQMISIYDEKNKGLYRFQKAVKKGMAYTY